jgi:hypothetical protein
MLHLTKLSIQQDEAYLPIELLKNDYSQQLFIAYSSLNFRY